MKQSDWVARQRKTLLLRLKRLESQAPPRTDGQPRSDGVPSGPDTAQQLAALVRMPTESVPLVWAALSRLSGINIVRGNASAGSVGSTQLGSLEIRFSPEVLDDVVYAVDLATGGNFELGEPEDAPDPHSPGSPASCARHPRSPGSPGSPGSRNSRGSRSNRSSPGSPGSPGSRGSLESPGSPGSRGSTIGSPGSEGSYPRQQYSPPGSPGSVASSDASGMFPPSSRGSDMGDAPLELPPIREVKESDETAGAGNRAADASGASQTKSLELESGVLKGWRARQAIAEAAQKVVKMHRAILNAAQAGDVTQLRRLLERDGVDPDWQRKWDGNTALHVAAQYARPEAIEEILQHGANRLKRNNDGDTPLDLADSSKHAHKRRKKRYDCMALLDPLSIFQAAKLGDLRRCQWLIERNPSDATATNSYNMSGLHFAVCHGRRHVAEYLIRMGADPYAANNIGQTPIGLAGNSESMLAALNASVQEKEDRAALARVEMAEARNRRAQERMRASVLRELTRGTTAALSVPRDASALNMSRYLFARDHKGKYLLGTEGSRTRQSREDLIEKQWPVAEQGDFEGWYRKHF